MLEYLDLDHVEEPAKKCGSEMRSAAEILDDVMVEPGEERRGPTLEDTSNGEGASVEVAQQWFDESSDPATRFYADVARVDLLTREEEEVLAVGIVEHRTRILKLLRARHRLVADALQGAGRGVVHPDDDFREREALIVLAHARRGLRAMRRTQRGRKTLTAFVTALGREMAVYRGFRDRMMTANVRLVMTLARRYHHPTLSYLDLVQEGVLGLMRAVEKYEPCRGIKFSTYAVWWIWQQISRAADCQGAMIRTPVHWNQLRRKLGRAAGPVERDSDVLAEVHGLSPNRLAVMSQSFQCLSLAAPMGDEDDRTLGDMLATNSTDDPEGAMLEADLGARLVGAVDELPAREAQILRLRFGLSGARTCTLEEIGQQFGVSRERIRQLEARALKRMREICDQRGLTDLLN
jgi:RNA polymerase sigma factor (sigma-70 family)